MNKYLHIHLLLKLLQVLGQCFLMRMIALLVLSFRSQELCYSLCQLSAFLMGRHISARFYFAVSLSSACNSKQLGFLLVYAVDAHSVP